MLCACVIASAGAPWATLAQTSNERAQLLEEKQISRMILELESSREQILLLERESAAKQVLIAKLDERISALTKIAELHKQAAMDREKALVLKDQVEKLYRESLKDANKQITRLKRSNKFWKVISGAGFLTGAALGIYLSK
jgi:hypothetical protein